MKKMLVMVAVILLVSAPAMAQEIDYCEGNFDYDEDVDGTDAALFKEDFGRSIFENPCPPPNPAPALVPKTGQTTSYATGDDGDLEKGVAWPNPRFTDNLDGTITDNLTGLIWLKDADCFGRRTWNNALSDSNGLENGECGLTDGSGPGDWRLPNLFELESLRDMEYEGPCIADTSGTGKWSQGDPFTNVQSNLYWSSTTIAFFTDEAWFMNMGIGLVANYEKYYENHVWPVRGGQ